MLAELLFERTEKIREDIVNKKNRVEEEKKYEENQLIELESLINIYSIEVDNTKSKFISESEDLIVLSDLFIKKLSPLLQTIKKFIETHSFYPQKNDYGGIYYSSTSSPYFPINIFDSGIEIPEVDEDIRSYISNYKINEYDSYDDDGYRTKTRNPSLEEKIKEINQCIKNIQELHPSRKFGLHWGVDGYITKGNGFFGSHDKEGVRIFGIQFTFLFPDQIIFNQKEIELNLIEDDNYLEELLIINLLDKPENLGFFSTSEIKSKSSSENYNLTLNKLDGGDTFLIQAYASLVKYASDNSEYGNEGEDKQEYTKWFDENLQNFTEPQAKKFLELAKPHGLEKYIFQLIDRLPIRNYFKVVKIFEPGVDHLQKAIESYLKGIDYGIERSELIGYVYKFDTLDREFLSTISNQLKSIGMIMILLHKKKKLRENVYCEIFDLLGNAAKLKEKNFLRENQKIADIFSEWIDLADSIYELDEIVNAWQVVQSDLFSRVIRRNLLSVKDSVKIERYLQALILAGGNNAIFASTYYSSLKM